MYFAKRVETYLGGMCSEPEWVQAHLKETGVALKSTPEWQAWHENIVSFLLIALEY